jgi:hypothetical protein
VAGHGSVMKVSSIPAAQRNAAGSEMRPKLDFFIGIIQQKARFLSEAPMHAPKSCSFIASVAGLDKRMIPLLQNRRAAPMEKRRGRKQKAEDTSTARA